MNTSESVADILLRIKAVSLNTTHPFRYTSGLLSPIYCDNRVLISHVEEREVILDAFLETIEKNALSFDVVAGTATAGIPHAAWIADHLKKPMVYVRSSSKAHGKKTQVEGCISAGQTALVIEDLISTGQSAIQCANALREMGAIVQSCMAIFTYDLDTAQHAFLQSKVKPFVLTNLACLLAQAVKQHLLSPQEAALITLWQKNPTEWEAQLST